MLWLHLLLLQLHCQSKKKVKGTLFCPRSDALRNRHTLYHQCFLLFNFPLKTVLLRENKWSSDFFTLLKIYIYEEQFINLIRTFISATFTISASTVDFSFTTLVMLSNEIMATNPPKNATTLQLLKDFRAKQFRDHELICTSGDE